MFYMVCSMHSSSVQETNRNTAGKRIYVEVTVGVNVRVWVRPIVGLVRSTVGLGMQWGSVWVIM